jgi:branched-chain amino acid transport system substrate-binding protein
MKFLSALFFLIGLLVAPAGYATQIVVGQVAPLTGRDANQGLAYGVGMQLLFSQVNKLGGVNGHTLSLVRKDDAGRPAETLSTTAQLLTEENPLVLAGYFGNLNVDGLLSSGILEKNRIAVVGYRIAEVRDENPLLFNVRAGLVDEIKKITNHLSTVSVTRLGLLYEDGPRAPALLAVADEAAKKANLTITVKATFPAGTVRISKAVEAFVNAPPQAILVVASGAAAASFIEQYRAAGGSAQLLLTSGADIEQLAKRLAEDQMQGISIAQVAPSPYKISGLLSKEFSDTVARSKNLEVPVSYAMIEGYITAKVIVEAVRRLKGKPTREGMVTALNSIENYDLGGYVVGFKPGALTGSKFVELSIITRGGKIRQ